MSNNLKNLTAKYKISHSELARVMEISRPTVLKILAGERELRMSEADKLAMNLGISVMEIFDNSARVEVVVKNSSKQKSTTKQDMRISVPIRNIKKFKDVLLYLTQQIGARPNVGQTALYKLLYFCDFDYYEKYEEQLIGATYIKNNFGPTPREFPLVIREMIKNEEIEEVKTKFFNRDQTKYLPIKDLDPKAVFTKREKDHIDSIIKKHGHKTAKQLSDLSHEDVPWITAEIGKDISYEAVFYRTKKTSVRIYEKD